ncbi:auxin-responsive protein SAUR40-like [Phalaenopsis equestris]|uniref:auxin-responsive protein SAUR40-like n=1 Tax=Phalaenopsis equestris TaxID=78828 RepID=UPI0009E2E19D|nr:auxin-responsive protein SAUR40-like [Phalaenopsis equestris]
MDALRPVDTLQPPRTGSFPVPRDRMRLNDGIGAVLAVGPIFQMQAGLKMPEPIVGGEGEKRPPKGHLVVYVGGGEMGKVGSPPQRCVVPVVYFNHPLFAELLREVEEEFGFGHVGGITIPCSVSRFERVKERIAGDTSRQGRSVWGSL